jgi:hypothetical protein
LHPHRSRSDCPHGRYEPSFALTPHGLSTLWRLVDDERLDERERTSLSKTLSELESARGDAVGPG